MKENLIKVKKEIQDCSTMEGWNEHCQVMLRALYGMNYSDFYDFISHICVKRINSLTGQKPLTVFGNWQIGNNYQIYDLTQLIKILEDALLDSDFVTLPIYENVKTLFTMLDNFLKKL